jgi:hypothetical protein
MTTATHRAIHPGAKPPEQPRGLTHAAVLTLMTQRRGRSLGLTARDAVIQLTGAYNNAKAREFRRVVMDLRDRGWPICSTAADGYFWPSSNDELKAALNWQRSRAIATLRQIGRQQRWGAQVLAGQQTLDGMETLTVPEGDPDLGWAETPPLSPANETPPEEIDRFKVLAAEIPEALWEAAESWMADRPGWTRDRVAAAAVSLFLMQKPGCDPAVTRIYLETLDL